MNPVRGRFYNKRGENNRVTEWPAWWVINVAVLFLEALLALIINSVLSIKIFITNYTATDRYQQIKCLDHIISLTNDLLFK